MYFRETVARLVNIFLTKVLQGNLCDCKSVLDVGCGQTSPLFTVKKTFYSEGIDIYKANILDSKKKKIHDKYKIGDFFKIYKCYKAKTFDAVIALDLVEHLKKKDGFKLIAIMESIARKKVIILTPNGYHLDMICEWNKDNPFQKHQSGWFKKDFTRLGYSVYGLRGLKYLRDENATIRYKPWFFWGVVVFFSEIILYFVPTLSFDLVAIKTLNENKS